MLLPQKIGTCCFLQHKVLFHKISRKGKNKNKNDTFRSYNLKLSLNFIGVLCTCFLKYLIKFVGSPNPSS